MKFKFKNIIHIFNIVVIILTISSCSMYQQSKSTTLNQTKKENNKTNKRSLKKNFPYKTYKNIIPAEKKLKIKKLNFPKQINKCFASCIGIYDKNNLFIVLYTEEINDYVLKELGLYNLTNDEYETFIKFKEKETYELCDYNKDYMVLRMTKDDWQTMSLNIFNISNKTLNKIFDYSQETINHTSENQILLKNKKIYFDNCYTDKHENDLRVDLYCYDIDTKKIKKIKKDAQNPMSYKDNILVFKRNENDSYKNLTSLNDKYKIETDTGLKKIGTNDQEVFCIQNIGVSKEERITIFQVKELTNNDPIISSSAISGLTISNDYIAWDNFENISPCVYDIKNKEILLFENIPAGENGYYLKDDYGIIISCRNAYKIKELFYFETIK